MKRLLCALLLLTACAGQNTQTLTVLAGSELRDLAPVFEDLKRDTGIELDLQYVGTLDGVEKLTQGETADLAWFSHGKYLNLVAPDRVLQQERIMLSPVVLGVKHSQAQAWGWLDPQKPVTWQDIAEKAAAGQLKFAMTSPSASNSGFTALMGLNAALKDPADLKKFFEGQALTAGSSGWLSEAFVREQNRLNAMVNYESVLLTLNQGGQLQEKLELIYPQEGIITADYPLMLLNKDQQEAYQQVTAYLKKDEVQKRIMDLTLRRPASTSVPLSAAFPNALLVELPFPRSASEVQQALSAFYTEQRKPAHAIFVLDVSGSMEGERLLDLQTSLSNLAGKDTSLTGRYASFQDREKVTLIPFNDQPSAPWTLLMEHPQDRLAVLAQVNRLYADGGTGIYSALKTAYDLAAHEQRTDPDRVYTIVLMSDGENNAGWDLRAFQDHFVTLTPALKQIKTFPILFGESSDQDMQTLATLTGGKVFDGRTSLVQVFKEIRSYQ